MTRVKSSRVKHNRHKKILKSAKGYRGGRHRLVRTAKEAVMHAGAYAFHGRKLRKRDKKSEWLIKINAALKEHNVSYSRFINGLKNNQIILDRKILAKIAQDDKQTFSSIVKESNK